MNGAPTVTHSSPPPPQSQPPPPRQRHPSRRQVEDDGSNDVHREQTDTLQRQPVLKARLANVKYLSTLLRGLHFKEKANCSVTEHGLKFMVEDSHCVQAIAYLNASLFAEYLFIPERGISNAWTGSQAECTFTVDLSVLQECLNIFGTAVPVPPPGSGGWTQHGAGGYGAGLGGAHGSGAGSGAVQAWKCTSVDLRYDGEGSELVLTLQDGGVVTSCKLTTFESEPPLVFDFLEDAVIHKVIMKSEWLYAALQELDSNSDHVGVLVSPDHPFFRLSTEAVHGSTEIDYPKDGDVLESFACEREGFHRYRLTHMQYALKALAISSKTSLRINERGFLSMQLMVPCQDKNVGFVEFLCAPIEEELGEAGEEGYT